MHRHIYRQPMMKHSEQFGYIDAANALDHGCIIQVKKMLPTKEAPKATAHAGTILTSAQTRPHVPEHIVSCGLFLHPHINFVPVNLGSYLTALKWGLTVQAVDVPASSHQGWLRLSPHVQKW